MAETPNPLVMPGTYWCAVVGYHCEAGIVDVYGPWQGQKHAEYQAEQLRKAGVHPDKQWTVVPLRKIDLGPANA